jgi:hypothetical protein
MSQRASETGYRFFVLYAIMQKQFFCAQGTFASIGVMPIPEGEEE